MATKLSTAVACLAVGAHAAAEVRGNLRSFSNSSAGSLSARALAGGWAHWQGCFGPATGWQRPGGNVPISAEGAVQCSNLCASKGYAYFGLECPMGSEVHCQCNNELTGSSKSDAFCEGAGDPLVHSHAHCVGPYVKDGFRFGDHSVGSAYSVVPAIVVVGAGYSDANGEYQFSGMANGYRSWASGSCGLDWQSGWGWGIGCGGHHRYHDKSCTSGDPTTCAYSVRGDLGAAPVPSVAWSGHGPIKCGSDGISEIECISMGCAWKTAQSPNCQHWEHEDWESYCDVSGITLCDGYDYTGTCFTGADIVRHLSIAEDLHKTPGELGTRDFNDHIRSVRVPLGCILHLFDERSHRGHRNDFLADSPRLCGGWDTGVSSLWLAGYSASSIPGQYLGSEDGCVGMFMPNPVPLYKWNAYNLNYHAAKWLEDNGMVGEVERAEHGEVPGARCHHDSDCKNLRCVYSVCRHGYPGDPCEHDSDCVPDFRDSWKKQPGVCVQNTCRNGYLGDFCEGDGDCQGDLTCKEDDAVSIGQGVAGGIGMIGGVIGAGSVGTGGVAILAVNPWASAGVAAVTFGAAIAEVALNVWGMFHVNQCAPK
mmetsp:Transcript_39589/g.99530  ORF Transcript_39589/g.99530 Transcript_39589/m.99530 type:complete len:593 (-) Transcript_39589:168-1946(-)